MQRKFSPYERNHLLRNGIDPSSILELDQTPVEYLTGKTEFCSHVFSVSPAALIPRVETEELVAMVIKEAQTFSSKVAIADIGTGCGAIAIALSLSLLEMQQPFSIIASDISKSALELTHKNRQQLLDEKQLQTNQSQFQIIQSNLLENYSNISLDILVANLPYIPTKRIAYLPQSVKDYEPHQALDGGLTGLELVDSLIEKAPKVLTPDGIIFLEVDYTHDEKMFHKYENNWNITLIKDSFHRQRFVKLTKKQISSPQK